MRHATVVLATAVATVAVCLVLAVVARRPDLVVVAAALAAGVVAAWRREPDGDDAGLPDAEGSARLRVSARPVREGDGVATVVEIEAPPGAAYVQVGLTYDTGLRTAAALWLTVPGEVIRERLTAVRWGRQRIGPVQSSVFGGQALTWAPGPAADERELIVLPSREVFAAGQVVPQAAGLVGTHRSRVRGDGTDLLGVAPFRPGDRLRRITWPTSLRTGHLHVSTTTEDRDAEVLLALDAASDVGTPEPDRVTSLDVTVRAAAAIAAHYLDTGDRVGAVDLGSARTLVRLGGSRRHLLRVLTGLLAVGARPEGRFTARRRLRQVTGRALVIVLSPLLDTAMEADLGVVLRSSRSVLVIDTLPAGAGPDFPNPDRDNAWRIALLQRDLLRERLISSGIPVVPWRGAGSLDIALRTLARASALPRRRG